MVQRLTGFTLYLLFVMNFNEMFYLKMVGKLSLKPRFDLFFFPTFDSSILGEVLEKNTNFLRIWYFASKIVLTFCEKKVLLKKF